MAEKIDLFTHPPIHLPSHFADVICGWYLARTANKAAKRMTTFPIVSEVLGHSQKLCWSLKGAERAHFRVMGKFKMVPFCLLKDYLLWKWYIFHQISPKMTTPLDLHWNYTNCSKVKEKMSNFQYIKPGCSKNFVENYAELISLISEQFV